MKVEKGNAFKSFKQRMFPMNLLHAVIIVRIQLLFSRTPRARAQ